MGQPWWRDQEEAIEKRDGVGTGGVPESERNKINKRVGRLVALCWS